MLSKQLVIRNYKESDIVEVVKVEKSAFPPKRQANKNTFKLRCKLFKKGFFIVEFNHHIVGFTTALLTNNIISIGDLNIPDEKLHNPRGVVYELRSLAIAKSLQKKGFGKLLIKKQLENAKKMNKKYFRFTAAKDVEGFYEKLDFKRITPYLPFHSSYQAIWEKKLF
ncbi:MAG: GNAT family N-acetyltransferase [Patescibacteria group bacterium]|mgnify:CR=1 FL=1